MDQFIRDYKILPLTQNPCHTYYILNKTIPFSIHIQNWVGKKFLINLDQKSKPLRKILEKNSDPSKPTNNEYIDGLEQSLKIEVKNNIELTKQNEALNQKNQILEQQIKEFGSKQQEITADLEKKNQALQEKNLLLSTQADLLKAKEAELSLFSKNLEQNQTKIEKQQKQIEALTQASRESLENTSRMETLKVRISNQARTITEHQQTIAQQEKTIIQKECSQIEQKQTIVKNQQTIEELQQKIANASASSNSQTGKFTGLSIKINSPWNPQKKENKNTSLDGAPRKKTGIPWNPMSS